MKKLQVLLCFILVLVAPLVVVSPAKAAQGDVLGTLNFQNCTTNSSADAATGGQYRVVVTDETLNGGPEMVGFTFYNDGTATSSISEVYFEDGPMFLIDNIVDGPGVTFTHPAQPLRLPSANTCPGGEFITTESYTSGATNPEPKNGVNYPPATEPEWVRIVFTLKQDKHLSDVESQLLNGDLRIGIHVVAFADGKSESFVASPATAIKLDSFSATANQGKVSLSWTTGTEIDNAGFNLYRAASPEGAKVKVNSGLISAAAGGASGASYGAVDAPGYGTFFYWLEDVSTGGEATLHGPVDVTLVPAFRLPTYRPVLPGS